jgi:hypothetical protein
MLYYILVGVISGNISKKGYNVAALNSLDVLMEYKE